MALRSVLEIDVNDDKFKAFRESFDKYRDVVDKLPGAWKAVGASAQATSNVFRDIAALTLAQSERIAMSVQQTQTLNRHLGVTHRQMGLIERTARSFGQHIADATRHIFSWRTALGLTGFAALDLFGISRLAQSASGGFRTATGLGTTWGGMSGFNVGFGQLLDSPQSMLGNIQQGKIDPTSDQRRALATLGFTPTQIAQMDPATLAGEAAVRMGAWARRQRPESLGTMAQVSGMASLAPIGDIINLRDRPEEAAAAREKARQAAEENRLTTGQLKRWSTLNQTLDEAKTRINTALVVGLGNMTPGLEKLIKTFSKAVADFLKSDTVAEWMDKLSEGLKSLAEYMKTDEFKRGVENVAATLVAFGRAVWGAVKWIARVFGENTGGEMGSIPPSYRRHGDKFGFGPARRGDEHSPFGNWIERWHDYFFGPNARGGTKIVPGGPIPEGRAATNDQWFNYASMRVPGVQGGGPDKDPGAWQHFSNKIEGIKAIEHLLLSYGQKGFTSLSQIISRWAPPSENPTASLIDRARRWMNVDPNKALDLGDQSTMQALITAMIANEHGWSLPRGLTQEDIQRAVGQIFTEERGGGKNVENRPAPTSHTRQRQAVNPTIKVVIDNRTGASIATLANMATASV